MLDILNCKLSNPRWSLGTASEVLNGYAILLQYLLHHAAQCSPDDPDLPENTYPFRQSGRHEYLYQCKPDAIGVPNLLVTYDRDRSNRHVTYINTNHKIRCPKKNRRSILPVKMIAR